MTVIRLAEDQMQRLMRCILAGAHAITSGNRATHEDDWAGADVMLEDEPKPKPGQVKVSGEGWVDPEPQPELVSENQQILSDLWRDCLDLRKENEQLKTQIECLQSNLDSANDRALTARQENEQLKGELASIKGIKRDLSSFCGELERGSIDDANRIRELEKENERLKAQVPKERLRVEIVELYGKTGCTYHISPLRPRMNRMSDHFLTKEEALQWAEDHGLEVVE